MHSHEQNVGRPASGQAGDVGELRDELARARAELASHREALRARTAELRDARSERDLASARHRALYERAPIGYLTLDGRGIVVDANPAAVAFLRAERATVIDRPLAALADPDAADELHLHVRAARTSGEPERVELALMRGDGSRAWTRIDTVALSDGDPVELVATLRDQSQWKRAESVLRRRESRLRAILETTTDAIVTIGDHGTIETFNTAAARIFGYRPEEVVGRDISRLIPALSRPDDSGRLCIPGDASAPTRDLEGRRKDHSAFPLELGVGELADRSGTIVAVIRDLTDRRRLEAEFRHAQKMEAVGRLSAGIAHDFNNLLMGILGCARMGSRRLDPEHPATRYLDRIADSVRAGSEVTKQLLAFSHPNDAGGGSQEFGGTLERTEPMLRHLLGEDVTFIVERGARPMWVGCSDGQIEQVIMNLAINARDAMPDGGKLTMELTGVALDARSAARCPDVSPGAFARLRVSDTGGGMNESTKTRVFEPFFSTKAPGVGTGLGLATVYGIAKAAGGHVSIDSEPGHGTSVEVLLPEVAAPRRTAAHDAAAVPGGGRGVVVVEDAPLVRDAVCAFLRHGGYRTMEAENAEQALAAIRAEPDGVHALVTDVVLPDGRGDDLAESVQRERPEIAVVFMSAYAPGHLREEAVTRRGRRFVAKPFSEQELARELGCALAETRALQ